MVLKFHSSLSQDLSLILNDLDDCNVTILVGKNQNIKEFRAHSYILRARSLYFKNAFFKRAFQTTFIASADGWVTIDNVMKFKKPNINPAVFEIILRYMYTGEVDLPNTLGINVLGLLIASDELLLKELFKHVQDYLIEKQANWIQKNFVLVLHSVFGLESCKKLKDYCLKSICADPQPFFTSKNFSSLNKDILYGLLERDDLQIEEIVVWDSLIKWGIEQTPGLGIRNSDRSKWNDRDFEALKETLNQFIPLIRFVEISPTEYFDKVRPYKAIIPNNICEEIEEYYFKGTLPKTATLPPRTGFQKIESIIIKPKLTRIIINWIERKDSNYNRNKKDVVFNFDLIYRRSRDGKNIIRKRCAGKGAVLILIKVKYSEKIFGGYNPIGWDDADKKYNRKNFHYPKQFNQYLSTTESFIFSFKNNEDIKNMEISRVVNSSYAIFNYLGNGINFGGGDLALENDRLSLSYTGYYECLNRNNDEFLMNSNYYRDQYEVEEIEAFRVVTHSNL
ncbi:BTB-domain-containing protein [Rhizophagus irregularis]|uniref:BTB-domain-containing protein n=1 Tax=Rhizophagus irregularis TaxID=588596 RepID=A0A2N1NET5_9GLOM|nr:BTB-domain-containing protein [Rhizophagus irregularis]